MNSYELSRRWFDFCFENPEKIKPNHSAVYFFAVEHCNRLGWKEKFGFPSTMVMESIGIKSYNTYINTLNEIVDFGFITMVEKSKNQYSSNIIALSNFNKADDKANDKALDKALIKHTSKQSESTHQSIDSIIKQVTSKQYNNKQLTKLKKSIDEFLNDYKEDVFNFRKELLNLNIQKQIVEDWLKVRLRKKASNTLTAFKKIKKEIELSELTANECIEIAVEKDWRGFEYSWLKPKTNGQQKQTPITSETEEERYSQKNMKW